MDGRKSSRPDTDPAPPLRRFDLEPTPEPSVVDVIEGVADALAAALDPAEPKHARPLMVLAFLKAAASDYTDVDEMLAALALQTRGWRSS
jgi:hypothetical protein